VISRDGKPRTYDRNRELAIEAGKYLKQKNPNVDVTVRDLEGVEKTVVSVAAAAACANTVANLNVGKVPSACLLSGEELVCVFFFNRAF
jgi:hypothetical protein